MIFILTLLSTMLTSVFSHAYSSSYNRSNMEWNRLVSVGGGISAPSFSTALFENPAGLVYNTHSKFLFSTGSSTTNSFRPLSVGAQFYTGNGTAGASIGFATTVNNANGSAFGSFNVPLGVAASLSSVSIGLAGGVTIGGGGTYANAFNLGINTEINYTTHWALMAYNLFGGLSGFGTGFAFDLSTNATIVVDAAADRTLRGFTLRPGIVGNLRPIQLALSYGFQVDNAGTAPISTGIDVGFGWEVGTSTHLQFYYNRLNPLYLALSVRL